MASIGKLRRRWRDVFIAGIFVLCGAGQVVAQITIPVAKRTVQVSGEGESRAKPDLAMITIGVETNAKTAAQAMGDNSKAMTELMGSIKSSGVQEKQIQTVGINLFPQYRAVDAPDVRPELIGFRATNQVRLTIDQLDALGEILDASVKAGANRIEAIQLDIRDKKGLFDRARKEAMADALRKAKLLAEEAGLELGAPTSISESTEGPPPRPMSMDRMAFAAKESVPIAPGEQVLKAQVQVTYELIKGGGKEATQPDRR